MCSVRKGVLTNFTRFPGKHLCQSLFFNKAAGLRHRCFPVNFVKFLRTAFSQTPSDECFLHESEKHWKIQEDTLQSVFVRNNSSEQTETPFFKSFKNSRLAV